MAHIRAGEQVPLNQPLVQLGFYHACCPLSRTSSLSIGAGCSTSSIVAPKVCDPNRLACLWKCGDCCVAQFPPVGGDLRAR